jgi:hypothetical protein
MEIQKITPERIQALMQRVSYTYQVIEGTTTTLCVAMLDGKFSLAIGHSACVDPRLYNLETGKNYAKIDAEAQAGKRLWELEGYRLYQKLFEEPEQIARMAHEVNKAYCESQGDASQPSWEHAPEWQRVSARLGVELHLSGDHGPEASHASWMVQKLSEGWTYGETKDPVAKTHPCMIPFDQLPPNQQAKDYLFRGVVHAFKEIV